MAKVKFTAGRVADFQCEAGKSQSFLWDTGAPGLGLRATASGAKSYIFQAKLNGQAIRVTIGDPDSWPIDAPTDGKGRPTGKGARQEARKLKTLIDTGIDPRDEKKKDLAEAQAVKLEAKRQDVTLGEVWPIYLKDRKPTWGDRHYQDHAKLAHLGGEPAKIGTGKTIPGPIAALFKYRLSELTGPVLKRWLEKESVTRPTRAALAFRLVKAFLNWCQDKDEYKNLAAADACTSRATISAIPKKNSKDDCLMREQLPAWFESVRAIPNPVISCYLQALLITGARREEMAGLKWTDVSFQWKTIHLADKVEDSGRVIPLTPYLASMLKRLPKKNQWVFSSTTARSGRLAEPRIAHNRAIAATGIGNITMHGLRRSFATLSEWVECPAGVVAQIQGHKPSATAEKHYKIRPVDLLRVWHERIEAWLLEQAGIEFKPEVSTPIVPVTNTL